jgi:hypothetical protein
MASAPAPGINSAGLVSWFNPPTPPDTWVLEFALPDESFSVNLSNSFSFAGTVTSYDAFSGGIAGGMRAKLYALDSGGNVILSPTYSGQYTKNQ